MLADARMTEELRLLWTQFPTATYCLAADGSEWIFLPDHPLPSEIWGRDRAHVAHRIQPLYPQNYAYGLQVEGQMLANGQPPNNYTTPIPTPFPGIWGQFSWYVEEWKISSEVAEGDNLLKFFQSFALRFAAGT
jgi:hypothetical protein